MQLPLPENWNGRLLNIGDGGKDGVLNFADHRLAQGYAVANSNTGHDAAAEPRATFAQDDLDAVIDFGHRAVPLTAPIAHLIASKRLPLISALFFSLAKFCDEGSIAIALCDP